MLYSHIKITTTILYLNAVGNFSKHRLADYQFSVIVIIIIYIALLCVNGWIGCVLQIIWYITILVILPQVNSYKTCNLEIPSLLLHWGSVLLIIIGPMLKFTNLEKYNLQMLNNSCLVSNINSILLLMKFVNPMVEKINTHKTFHTKHCIT